jgi:VCBS repeat-containing protein
VTVDVLANDTDADGDEMGAYVVCGPEHGRLCRNEDGTWTYLADQNWSRHVHLPRPRRPGRLQSGEGHDHCGTGE